MFWRASNNFRGIGIDEMIELMIMFQSAGIHMMVTTTSPRDFKLIENDLVSIAPILSKFAISEKKEPLENSKE